MFKHIRTGLLTAAVFAGALLATAPMHAADSMAPVPGSKDVIYSGDAKCTSCHDESESVPVLSIAKTKHGVAKDGRVPSCTSCHGESDAHAGKVEGKRPPTDRAYGKHSKLTAEELIAHCRKHLTGYKVPKHVEFRADLPRTNVGKILRRALKEGA